MANCARRGRLMWAVQTPGIATMPGANDTQNQRRQIKGWQAPQGLQVLGQPGLALPEREQPEPDQPGLPEPGRLQERWNCFRC